MPPAWINGGSRRLNDYLDRIDDGTLKRFSKLTGGPAAAHRQDWTTWMQLTLERPERLKSAVEGLPASERAILAILRDLGGESEDTILRAAAFGAGVTFPGRGFLPKQVFHDALAHLIKTGLALNWNDSYSLTRLYQTDYFSGHTNSIFSDERVLVHAGPVPSKDPALASSRTNAPTQARLPHLITMQMVGLFQAIEHSGGIGLTQAGAPRAVDVRKIAKAIHLPDGSLVDGALVFPGAVMALVGALRGAGLLFQKGEEAVLKLVGAQAFIEQPLHQMVRALLWAMVGVLWAEGGGTRRANSSDIPAARAALLYLLRALPAERTPLYTLDSLDEALFERISPFFSMSPTVYRASFLSNLLSLPDARAAAPDHQRTLRREWAKNERPWLEKALSSWLYFLGVVELAVDGGQIRAVRLTDLGRAALHPDGAVTLPAAPRAEEGPAWVIQPNFDIIAYLDRVNTTQLAFLERHADRRSAAEHLAEYRLTRDSVYRGLESGTRLDELLEGLQSGSGRDLPQNIVAEIREWATQRERIVLRRRASLAEFPSEAARELAMRAGLTGKPVGERYLMLTTGPNRPLSRIFRHTINYDQAPQRNLLIGEDGVVTYHHPTLDLLLRARLDAWTEPHASGGRVFTHASIQKAVGGGRSLSSLLKLIDDRQYKILPPLVRLSLRAWAGEKFATTVEPVTILRTLDSELTYAIQQSDLLRPYLISTITPGVFLVRNEKVEDLRAVLRSLGFEG